MLSCMQLFEYLHITHYVQGCCKKTHMGFFEKAHLKKPTKEPTLYFSFEKSTKK